MSQFVHECAREWNRLGVPEAAANEMAADLEADLGDAKADGVSPEEVLGNGYFDAKSFASSWATARGFVRANPRLPKTINLATRTLTLGVIALVSLAIGGIGFLILVGRHVGSAAVAASPFRARITRPVPGIFVGPHRFMFAGPGSALDPLGLVLLAVGVVGVGITLWFWRPWSPPRNGPGLDQDVGMASYL